ncbi:solute carrier family 2, facilitated glucose transporter member 8-like [Ornithodoros turicata]|uniref:solute carrier family 2, facilitated glucose transporter member 8-like n=1 Tax=Ornithodoros turicata TaxID=34597 RepID=UPI003139C2DB
MTVSARRSTRQPQTTTAWIGSLSVGTALGYTSSAFPSMAKLDSGVFLNEDQQTWFGALLTLGALIASPVAGLLADATGRRGTMVISAAGSLLGWLTIAVAGRRTVLYAGRIVTGFSVGMTSLVVPMYVSEVSVARTRGVLGAAVQLSTTIGIVSVYACGKICEWRLLSVTCMIPPSLMVILLWFVPESPRWLLVKGKRNKALHAARFLYGESQDTETLSDAVEESVSTEAFRVRELKLPSVWRPLLLSVFLMVSQQLSGINCVMFYAVKIFRDAQPASDPMNSIIGVGAVQVGATLFGTLVMDKLGRRKLLLTSVALLAASLCSLGTFFYVKETQGSNFLSDVTWFPLASLAIFIVAFSLGMGPVPWLMVSELLSQRIKGFATSVSTCFNWGTAFIITKVFNDMRSLLGSYGTYRFFSVAMVICLVIVTIYLPETKGRTLEDIQRSFRDEEQRGTAGRSPANEAVLQVLDGALYGPPLPEVVKHMPQMTQRVSKESVH